MAQNKIILMFLSLVLLLSFAVLCGCAEKGAGSDLETGNYNMNSNETTGDLDSVTPGESSGDDSTIVETPPEVEKPPVTQWEEKIYWTGTINDDFTGNEVLVTLDKNIGGPNKIHDKSFFGDIEIESIRDLTWFTGDIGNALVNWEKWRQILEIKLPGDSKENVVMAIRHLEKINGILYAGPNHIGGEAGV